MSKAVQLSFGDHEYILRVGQVTGRHRMQVRKTTGVSLMSALAQLGEDPDLDTVAVIYYAAAVQAGDDPNWNTIIDSVSPDCPIALEFVEDVPGEA
jgi:hypothetical protein